MMSRSSAWMPRPQGRRTQAIINTNLKTELCRNWQNGACTYGERCAFAHGKNELKYRTLREMQNAGRIPDAAKYRCFPCMTWVATGSCPYSTRCVFIHDPRVSGPVEAWLYAGSHPSSAYHSSDSSFFFPDLPRDPDSLDLPRGPSLYDLDPSMATAEDRADRAVYSMWYSFVSTFSEDGGDYEPSAMVATTVSPLAIKPGLNFIRDTSQTTGSISFYTDSDSCGTPSEGSSPSPPPPAESITYATTNNDYNIDPSPSASLGERLPAPEPSPLDTSSNRLPVFLHLGKGRRAPPLNALSLSASSEGSSLGAVRPLTLRDRHDSHRGRTPRTGLAPPPDYIYEPNLCTDGGVSPYRQRSISPPTHAEDESLYYNIPVPRHSLPATAAVTKTPPPDYDPVSKSRAIPAVQPEIIRHTSSNRIAHDGIREDSLSAAMRIETAPPGYVVQRHQHLPSFSGYPRVGSLVDTALTQPRTMYSVASF